MTVSTPQAIITLYPDMDGDSYGDMNMPFESCGNTPGYVVDSSDCDDADAMTYPEQAYLESPYRVPDRCGW